MKGILLIAVLIIVLGIGIGTLTSGLQPTKEYKEIVLPDELEIRGTKPIGSPTRKSHSAVDYKYNDLNEIHDLIENYFEDTYELENSIEDLRREQEAVKELLQKIEKERNRRHNDKHFWTLKYREL